MRATNCSANGTEGRATCERNAVDWRKVQRSVSNLRRRIFRASKEGDQKVFRCGSDSLEPCARKPASTVLRGEWRSDAPFLPD